MKHTLFLLLSLALLVGCKTDKANETTSEENITTGADGKTLKQNENLIAIKGKYLFVEKENAAVLQTAGRVYGVVIDDQVKALNEQVLKYKKDQYTMVPVTVKGRVFKKENISDEWENKIEIIEILNVSEPTADEDVIKLGSK